MIRPKPVVLAIVSGFGVSPIVEGNAIRSAKLPSFSHLLETYPVVTLDASGAAVGLTDGARGTSRAGCRTIGAGRAIPDAATKIAVAVERGTMMSAPVIRREFERIRRLGGAIHLVGSIGRSGSMEARTLSALLRDAREQGLSRVFVHAILRDGHAETDVLADAEATIREAGVGALASILGAEYALDRDRQWDRVRLAYEAITLGTPSQRSWMDAVRATERVSGSESAFVPVALGGDRVRPGDTVLFFDTVSAEIRELATAMALPAFSSFTRPPIANIRVVTIVEIDPDLPIETAFAPPVVEGTLGEAIASAGLRQLRIAETEGFFDLTEGVNGSSVVLPGEERLIIPGPFASRIERVPDMASAAVADCAVKEIIHGKYDVIFVGFVAPDGLARTGDEAAAAKACEAVDRALGRVAEATFALDGVLLVVADHGHAEGMRDPATGEIEPVGTRNPVPFIIAGRPYEGLKAKAGDVVGGDLALTAPAGTLADIAPTMLKILGIPAPKEMKGEAIV